MNLVAWINRHADARDHGRAVGCVLFVLWLALALLFVALIGVAVAGLPPTAQANLDRHAASASANGGDPRRHGDVLQDGDVPSPALEGLAGDAYGHQPVMGAMAGAQDHVEHGVALCCGPFRKEFNGIGGRGDLAHEVARAGDVNRLLEAFHSILQQCCLLRTKRPRRGTGPSIYEAFSRASRGAGGPAEILGRDA